MLLFVYICYWLLHLLAAGKTFVCWNGQGFHPILRTSLVCNVHMKSQREMLTDGFTSAFPGCLGPVLAICLVPMAV